MRRVLLLVALAAATAACGGGRTQNAMPFAYNRGAPLRFHRGPVVASVGPIAVRDVSYASPRGGRVPGFLLLPPGRGPHPAVIYMHGAGGDRSQMLHLATWMAARGAVALTIDSPLARLRSPIQQGMAGLRKIQDLTVVNVVDLRRAVDVLDALPEVDRRRIAYVGYSAGARAGAVLAGVEHRIKAYDLVSGGATPPRAYLAGIPKSRRGEVLRLLHKVDPLRYVRQAAPSALFFQDGRSDGVVPSSALVGLARAASKPKLVRWYPAGHNLDAVAFRDQLRWLSARLGLGARSCTAFPPVPEATGRHVASPGPSSAKVHLRGLTRRPGLTPTSAAAWLRKPRPGV